MITFVLIFAVVIVLFAGWMIAKGATQRKRSGQSSEEVVRSTEQDSVTPEVRRATGND